MKSLFIPIFTLLLCGSLSSQIIKPEQIINSYYFSSEKYYKKGLIRLADIKLELAFSKVKGYSSEDKKLLLDAEIEFDKANYVIAENLYTNFIVNRQNSPLQPFAAYRRAVLSFYLNKFDKAEFYFDQTRKLAEENFAFRSSDIYEDLIYKSYYWRGLSFYNLGKLIEAKNSFDICQTKYPRNPLADDALFALGLIAEQTNLNEDAIVYYKKVRQQYPSRNNYLICLLREASNYLVQRNPSSAAIQLERAEQYLNQYSIQLSKKDTFMLPEFEEQSYIEEIPSLLLFLKAETSNLANNFDASLKYYKEFITSNTSSPLLTNAEFGYGYGLLNKNDISNAIKYFDIVIEKNINQESKLKAASQLYRAIALKKKGDTLQASKELAALSQISGYPYLALALIELGQIQIEAKEYSSSKKTLERAEREASDQLSKVRAKILLGASYLELGMWDKAIIEYREARQIAENNSLIIIPDKFFYINESLLKEGYGLLQSQKSNEAITVLNTFIAKAGNDKRVSEAIFWLAESYYRSDLITNAIESYENLIDKYYLPERREEILYGLGWSHFRRKQFEKSSKYFDLLVKEFPKSKHSVEVLTRQGDGYYLEKKYAKAAESYSKAAKLSPNSEEGQYSAYQLCHAYYRNNRLDLAISSLLDFVRRYNKSSFAPNAMYLTGWIKFQQKKYKEAVDNYNYLIDAFPQSGLIPRAYYSIGDCFFNQENYEKAMTYYRIVIETYPNSSIAPEAMRSLQQSLELLGREDEALKIINEYTQSNEESPFYREFKEKAASILFDNRKYKDAIVEFENIVNKNPDNPKNVESIYWIGKSYAGMDNTDEAEKAFNLIITKYPKSEQVPLAIYEKAILKKKANQIAKADELLLEILQKFPDNPIAPQVQFERAVMKFSAGDTLGSMAIYRIIADKYDRNDYAIESRYRVAKFNKNSNKLDSALLDYAVLSKYESNPEIASEALYRMGEIYLEQKNDSLAIEKFDIIKEKFSGTEDWFSLSILALAEIYERKENYEKAIEFYNIIISLRPEDDFGKTAKTRIKSLRKN